MCVHECMQACVCVYMCVHVCLFQFRLSVDSLVHILLEWEPPSWKDVVFAPCNDKQLASGEDFINITINPI